MKVLVPDCSYKTLPKRPTVSTTKLISTFKQQNENEEKKSKTRNTACVISKANLQPSFIISSQQTKSDKPQPHRQVSTPQTSIKYADCVDLERLRPRCDVNDNVIKQNGEDSVSDDSELGRNDVDLRKYFKQKTNNSPVDSPDDFSEKVKQLWGERHTITHKFTSQRGYL